MRAHMSGAGGPLLQLAAGVVTIALGASVALTGLAIADGAPRPGLELVADGFEEPVGVVDADDGSGRIFVLEKAGAVYVVEDGRVRPEPFLDLRGRLATRSELGLLGLAFDPDHRTNGRFYVHYSDLDERSVLAEFAVGPDPNVADLASETQLLVVPQPSANHNGGQLAFGPDGHLYVAFGDGGVAADPAGAQDLSGFFGKLLRIAPADGGYTVPDDNPFVDVPSAQPEIWAYGLRNPWRFSFDSGTGDLFVADVGQDRYEEVNVQRAGTPGGQNYGWPTTEGTRCFPAGADCAAEGITAPIVEYPRELGSSVIGGYVYRGSDRPDLAGRYVFGDFVSGTVWTAGPNTWEPTVLLETDLAISSFGEDAAGELYVVDFAGGLYRLT